MSEQIYIAKAKKIIEPLIERCAIFEHVKISNSSFDKPSHSLADYGHIKFEVEPNQWNVHSLLVHVTNGNKSKDKGLFQYGLVTSECKDKQFINKLADTAFIEKCINKCNEIAGDKIARKKRYHGIFCRFEDALFVGNVIASVMSDDDRFINPILDTDIETLMVVASSLDVTNKVVLGVKEPKKKDVIVPKYERDAAVIAEVLKYAHNRCELCGTKPFLTCSERHYLEVHHVRRLADGGSDTVTNTVALCPNCHKEIHFGINAPKLIEQLYSQVQRLVRE
ncbi:TPA: HNH endonuclease [Vibrio parahaemolyticus]